MNLQEVITFERTFYRTAIDAFVEEELRNLGLSSSTLGEFGLGLYAEMRSQYQQSLKRFLDPKSHSWATFRELAREAGRLQFWIYWEAKRKKPDQRLKWDLEGAFLRLLEEFD